MGLKGVATVLPRKVEEMPGEGFFTTGTVAGVAEPCGEGTTMLGDAAFLVSSLVLAVLGKLVREPWLTPYDGFVPLGAAATKEAGCCCAAIGLGDIWLPEGPLESVPVEVVGFEGIVIVLSRDIEETLGGAFFAAVTVVEVAEPRGEGAPMFGGTAFGAATLDPSILGRLVWEPWLLPYDAFPPFDATATAGTRFCCGAIGLGANWLPGGVLEGVPIVAGGFEEAETVFLGEIEEGPGEIIFDPVTVEPCLEGSSVAGDSALLVSSLVLGVVFDRLLLLGLFTLSMLALLFGLRSVVPVCDGTVSGAFFSLR